MKTNLKLLCLSIVRRTRELGPENSQNVYSLLKGFRDGEIHTSHLVSVLTQVFSGHHHLLQLLESILPHDPPSPNSQECSSDDDHHHHAVQKISQEKKRKMSKEESVNLEQVTEFINRVRERFPDNDDDGIYSTFIDALCTLYDKKNDDQKAAAIEVKKELNLLFTDNTDLTVIHLPTIMADDRGEKEPWESRERKRKYEATPEKKHPCEEMLLKIEEDQYECDMVYYHIRTTRKIIQNLVEDVKEGRISMPIVLENYLPVIYMRCIERVYGMTGEDEGYGQVVIEKLRENPIKAGEIVLRSLYRKEKEIKNIRRELTREVWAKAIKDCHEKWQCDIKFLN